MTARKRSTWFMVNILNSEKKVHRGDARKGATQVVSRQLRSPLPQHDTPVSYPQLGKVSFKHAGPVSDSIRRLGLDSGGQARDRRLSGRRLGLPGSPEERDVVLTWIDGAPGV